MSGDLLSEVLRSLRLTGTLFYAEEAGTPWVIAVPDGAEAARDVVPGADHLIAFHAVVSGTCWVGLGDRADEPMEGGEIAVFPQGDPHVFASLAVPSGARPTGTRPPNRPPWVRAGTGPSTARIVCGFLACQARLFDPLLSALPAMFRVRVDGPMPGMMEIAALESELPRPGSEALLARLAETLLVESVRLHLAGLPADATGWLAGLRDAHVARALAALHARPAAPWTLEELAKAAGLSRSALHERFAAVIGQAPMQYLARWRMQLAAARLAAGGEKVAAIAQDVGYESEAAFNRAFKRLVGTPPALWRRAQAVPRTGGAGGSAPR